MSRVPEKAYSSRGSGQGHPNCCDGVLVVGKNLPLEGAIGLRYA